MPQGTNETGTEVEYRRIGKVAYLELARPDVLNALSDATFEQLDAALERFEHDDGARVGVLRAQGRAFCAGLNLSASPSRPAGEISPWENRTAIRHHVDLFLRFWDCPKPVIAQVQGHCLAAGVMLAVSCDVTIVAEDARIGWPKLPVGGGFISHLVAWFVGPKHAKEMSFVAGSEIDGQTAAEWGIANRAVSPNDLERVVDDLATEMALLPSSLLALKKSSINRIFNAQGFRESILASAELDALAHLDPGVQVARTWMRADGFKTAVERFRVAGL